jgi:hypothetical protein
MFDVVLAFIVCFGTGEPHHCRQVETPFEGSLMQCMLFGQHEVARWINENAGAAALHGWKCQAGKPARSAAGPGFGLPAAFAAAAAHQDVDPRPAGADSADKVAQNQQHLGTVRGFAGPQDHHDRLARTRFVDMDRQETALVIVGVEQRELIAGIVDVEHDPVRHLVERVGAGFQPLPVHGLPHKATESFH